MRASICEGIKNLVNVNAPNIWNAFNNCVLKACDEVCEKQNE